MDTKINTQMESHELAISLKNAKLDGNRWTSDACSREREPHVQRIARCVSTGYYTQEKLDFIESAFPLIWEKIQYFDPNIANFKTWTSRVLSRAWIDSNRKMKHRRSRGLGEPDVQQSFPFSIVEPFSESQNEPFTSRDLAVFASWPTDRVELLGISGFHARMPQDCWSKFVREYEVMYEHRLTCPFPPTFFWERTEAMELFVSSHRTFDAIRMNYQRKAKVLLLSVPSIRADLNPEN